MGDFFRNFWIPALLSAELPDPDGPPVRVRLLNEDLVAFRNSEGQVGLLDAHCPHRRAELYFGRNEESGLRCVYHGWKFNVAGQCVDMPNEENGCQIAGRMTTTAYPIVERGGIVWAWMGNENDQPQLPEFEFSLVGEEQVHLSKCLMRCNYLQALEGSIDYSHISFLHKELKDASASADVFGIGEQIKYANKDGRPTISSKPTEYGMQIAARRNANETDYFWRLARWLMPITVIVPTEIGNVCRANIFVPIDDENCWWYRVRWRKDHPLSHQEINGFICGGFDYAELVSDSYVPRGSRENDYLQDRKMQKSASFTGIPSAQLQDLAIQESQGKIHDRGKEKLMRSDVSIVMCRRLLLKLATEFRAGVKPPVTSRPELFRGYAYAVTKSRSVELEELLREMQF